MEGQTRHDLTVCLEPVSIHALASGRNTFQIADTKGSLLNLWSKLDDIWEKIAPVPKGRIAA